MSSDSGDFIKFPAPEIFAHGDFVIHTKLAILIPKVIYFLVFVCSHGGGVFEPELGQGCVCSSMHLTKGVCGQGWTGSVWTEGVDGGGGVDMGKGGGVGKGGCRQVQGLFVSFARIGSGDPVRVLCLFHNKYTGYN